MVRALASEKMRFLSSVSGVNFLPGWTQIADDITPLFCVIVFAGLSYKPNVADLRNSISLKIYKKLKRVFSNIIAYEPILNRKIAKKLNIEVDFKNIKKGDVFIVLVKHNKFKNLYSYVKKNNKLILDPFK